MKSVVFSPAAIRDLERIGDSIAFHNPARARSFVQELRQRCVELSALPLLGVDRSDLLPGVRTLVHGNYLLFYRVLPDHLRIERVLNGAQHLPGSLAQR